MGEDVNTRRAAATTRVGSLAGGFSAATWLVFAFSAVYGVNPVFGGAGSDPGVVDHLGTFVLAPVTATVGGALPARALGFP